MRFKDVSPGGLWSKARPALRQRTYLHASDDFREWLERLVPTDNVADLEIPFECVAACIEDASERWFSAGSLIDSILASSAVPGLLPPVEIDGEYFIDGGVVNSIPISRAYASGAKTVYVMHVGHVDDPLEAPTAPWDVAVVAFEISRRHRLTADLSAIPDGTTVHVLPTGAPQGRYNDSAKLRYADLGQASDQIVSASRATSAYLEAVRDAGSFSPTSMSRVFSLAGKYNSMRRSARTMSAASSRMGSPPRKALSVARRATRYQATSSQFTIAAPIRSASSRLLATHEGEYPAALNSALRADIGTSRYPLRCWTISLLGFDRPVSRKEMWWVDTPASSPRRRVGPD
jgi:NTE family protein